MIKQIDDIAETCQRALAASNSYAGLVEVLSPIITNRALCEKVFADLQDEETLIFANEKLTIVHIRLSPNVHFPPHNHGMRALIGIWSGQETNIFYRSEGTGVKKTGEHTYAAGEVITIDANAIHSVANTGEKRSAALHIYCGDLIHQDRKIWHHYKDVSVPYSDETYFGWSEPFNVSKPFTRPDTCHAHAQ